MFASNETTLKPGALVAGRFLLEERIGFSRAGTLFKARDTRAESQLVTIEVLDWLPNMPAALEAVRREVRRMQELAHPNVISIREHACDGPLPYLCLEPLEGHWLETLTSQRALPFDEAWPIVRGMGSALAHAHRQGVVHSDFMPCNVFIAIDGRVKVLDFGIVEATRSHVDKHGATVFAYYPEFKSPDWPHVSPREDVYALALVTYELLAGEHPFQGRSGRHAQERRLVVPTIQGLSRRRMRALERALAFEREKRTPSVEEFLTALEAEPTTSRWLRITAAAVGVVLAAAAYWYAS